MATSDDTLDVVTRKINAVWKKRDDYRVTLALLVWRAKQMVESGDDPYIRGRRWSVYASEEFGGRHPGEIRKLLKIGMSSDPSAAHQEEKAAARGGMARLRARRANVGAGSNLPRQWVAGIPPDEDQPTAPVLETALVTIETVKQAALLLSADDRTRLVYWLIPLLNADDHATLAVWLLDRETRPAAA